MLPPDTAIFRAEYVRRHSRLTTFFRLLLVIPHYILLMIYGIAASFGIFVAWFVVVVSARYPAGLYEFVAGYLRYSARVAGYVNLLTDAYPPFSGSAAEDYPVALLLGPPKERYSRLLAFFRFLLLIPVWIVSYVLNLVLAVAVLVAWFVVVITGRLPHGLHKAIAFGTSYASRAGVYASLLTERFPSFGDAPLASTDPATADDLAGIGR